MSVKGFCKRTALALAILTTIAGPAMARPSQHAESRQTQAAVLDIIVARPVGVLVTGVGAVLFAISLPFSIVGGNVDEAAQMLVIKPARHTFARCLGCVSSESSSAAEH